MYLLYRNTLSSNDRGATDRTSERHTPVRELTPFIMNNLGLIVVIVLVAIVVVIVLLAVIATSIKKQQIIAYVEPSSAAEAQITQLKEAANHYTDVSAVVAILNQLGQMDNDALERLKSYPETARAAALLHYVSILESDLEAAQESLSRAHTGKDRSYSYSHINSQSELINERQQHVNNLRDKLDEAVKLSGLQSGLRAV